MGLFSKDIKTFDDLFVHQLQDIYYAEKQLVNALPKMADKATDPELKRSFLEHLDQTKGHVARLEQVFKMHNAEAKAVTCPAIDGIIEEGEEIMEDFKGAPALDAGLLAAAQEAAEATRDQYFVAYKAAVLGALEDVENAIVAYRQERIKNGRLAAATASYRKASELAQSLYQSGSSSFLDVLDAERSLYSAEDSLLTSTVAIANTYIALNKALGGGWDGVVDASKPEVVDTQTGPRLRTAAAN